MSEIKRYAVDFVFDDVFRDQDGFGMPYVNFKESPQGEWVRWEDVQNLLQKQEDNYAHETQLLTERINRLVSKND